MSQRQIPVEEQEFLAAYHAERYARPSVSVDVALISSDGSRLRVLLVRRAEHPFRGSYTLPGGFVGFDESLDAAARRVLSAKTGVDLPYLEQLYTFGAPERDPRTRVISVAYYALVPWAQLQSAALTADAVLAQIDVPWSGETGGTVTMISDAGELEMGFDHAEIVGAAIKRLRGKLNYAPVGYALLPAEFTLRQLQRVHEVISGAPLNKDSFRRRMLASGELAPTGARQDAVGHRPAAKYRVTSGEAQ